MRVPESALLNRPALEPDELDEPDDEMVSADWSWVDWGCVDVSCADCNCVEWGCAD